MFYFALTLIISVIFISILYVFLVLYHNWRHKKYIDIEIENITEYEFPGYELPIFVEVEVSSNLDLIENLIYEAGSEVLYERNGKINYKPEISIEQ